MDTLPLALPTRDIPRESNLSDQQLHFCDEFIKFPDEAKAKASAGYHSSATPMKSPKVLNEIRQRQAERRARTDIDATYLLVRLGKELDADLADLYFESTGNLKPIHEWPLIWRQGLVAGIETVKEKDGSFVDKVKLSDRTKRLEMIGKHVNVQAFKEQVAVTTDININVSAVELLNDYIKTINVTPNDVAQLPPIPKATHAAE